MFAKNARGGENNCFWSLLILLYILKGLEGIKAIIFSASLYSLSFFANTPFKVPSFVAHPVGKCSQLSVGLGVFPREQKFFLINDKKNNKTLSSRAGCREPILVSPQETANYFSYQETNNVKFFSRIITIFLFVK